ncbi:SDR family oxidoreductase [Kaustia mangrovi]|uniref:SDR family oxidoreductase n=1 Tax=Kaustia mangrovi TaxID=2593653 RepID=A0A7S8C3D2_9HYPH|nr:SDR family oxidoreductase [Kaustia mangrovi]QPC42621.1 SDR family oxidoreductase [Kaustia mangrovi]
MELGLRGTRVLVTAGASGIGLEMVRAFHAEGAAIVACDVNEAALSERASELPDVTWLTADVADRAQVEGLFDDAVARLGGLDVLINNAGVAGPTGRVEEIAPEDWDRTLEVNITGQFNCARLAVPHLRKSDNPSIANLASAAGRLGFAMRSPYAASKWAVVGLTKSLSMELGADGIRVNALLPGSVDGPRIRSVFENKAKARGVSVEEVTNQALSASSLGRLIPPEHIASMAVYLASPLGATVSGQAISVCGDLQMLV